MDPFEKLRFRTAVGQVEWRPDEAALQESLFNPVEEIDAEDNAAMANVLSYYRHIFISAVQDAMEQAVEELLAIAQAPTIRDRHEREEVAKRIAEKARESSRNRLRVSQHLRRSPKRGDKKRPSIDQRWRQFGDEQNSFKGRLEEVITKLLGQRTRPTLANVAQRMNISDEEQEISVKTLGRKLRKWINPNKTPKAILDGLVEEIKKNRTF